jgi:hypothetical protein
VLSNLKQTNRALGARCELALAMQAMDELHVLGEMVRR